MNGANRTAKLNIRIVFDEGHLGRGKIELLEKIAEVGSISAAAKATNMSYRRAWHLIKTLQDVLREDVVATSVGGKAGGGAMLTPAGELIVCNFREMESALLDAAKPYLSKMDEHLRPSSD